MTTNTTAQGGVMTPILHQMSAAPTLPAGLTALRHGLAAALKSALGPEITGDVGGQFGNTGEGAGSGSPNTGGINITQLNDIYQSLVSDDQEWTEALIANTEVAGMSEDTERAGTTASKSAFA